ncbi:hypothetical protein GQ457_03G012090 [Hibiscus cannabinus]
MEAFEFGAKRSGFPSNNYRLAWRWHLFLFFFNHQLLIYFVIKTGFQHIYFWLDLGLSALKGTETMKLM